MSRHSLVWVLVSAVCLLLIPLIPSGASAQLECFPPCREGFTCIEGQCLSACNPACAPEEICTSAGECIVPAPPPAPPAPPAAAPEPPAPRQLTADEEIDLLEARGRARRAAEEAQQEGEAGRYPAQVTARPMTMPEGALAGSLAFFTYFPPGDDADTVTAIGAESEYGITDDIQVSAQPLSFTLTPELDLGSFNVGLLARFTRGVGELGGSLSISTDTDGNVHGSIGLPFNLHLGSAARIDVGAYLGYDFDGESDPFVSLPMRLVLAAESAFFLIGTSVHPQPFIEEAVYFPLTVALGFTVPNGEGMAVCDVALFLGFPALLQPEADEVVDADGLSLTLVVEVFRVP